MVKDSKTLENIQMNIEQRILAIHPYKITKPQVENGRWQTYVKNENEKRKILRAPSYDDLMQKLYEHYFYSQKRHVPDMQELFKEWLSYKEDVTDSANTIRRHEQHWKKYFSDWYDKKIIFYDKLELQRQCNLLVKKHNLSSKEWQNIKTILSGMFAYALDKKYIKYNPMSEMRITVKFRQINKKTGDTETFQTEDKKVLIQYFDSRYSESSDSVYLALKLDFYLGLRVGELSALKWGDVINLKGLHVTREEIKESVRHGDSWKDVCSIADHTKTRKDRIVPLVPSAAAILNALRIKSGNPDSDSFIFVRNNERITSRQITYALEKACRKCGITVKRTHKIRKTVASNLNAAGVPADAIREMLGHTNLETTMGYIFNPLTEKETYRQISKAL